MGRHKDPETVQFIESLKKKAESLGFRVIDEFKVLQGLFWVDLSITPYERGHETYITLEIETRENERIYKNLAKIFDLPSQDLEKPFHHFIVIYKGKLTRGNRLLMHEKAKSKNVHLFEDLQSDQGELERFYTELEDLKISISEYISRKGSVNPVETVKETIGGLGKVTPVLIIEKQQYPINQATLISGLSLPKENSLAMSAGQLFDSTKYRRYALIAIPEEIYTIVIPGTRIALDTYLEVRRQGENSFYTLETCNYPFVITIEKGKTAAGNFTKIDPSKADAVQLKMFEDIQLGLLEKHKLEIFDFKSKKIFWAEGVKPINYKPSTGWYDLVTALANIQDATSTRIPVPKDLVINAEEQGHIQTIKKILENGEIAGNFTEVTVIAKKDIITKLVELQKTHGNLEDLKLIADQSFQPLFDTSIPLGEVHYEFSDMIFQKTIGEIEQLMNKMGPDEAAEVIFISTSGKLAKAVYPKWKKV